MHRLEYVLEKERHDLLRNFEMQTDHQFSTRIPDLQRVNEKEICQIMDFAVPVEHREKIKESKKKKKIDQYLNLARGLKKRRKEQKVDDDMNCNWYDQNVLQRLSNYK